MELGSIFDATCTLSVSYQGGTDHGPYVVLVSIREGYSTLADVPRILTCKHAPLGPERDAWVKGLRIEWIEWHSA